jgi:hypothetical protein
MTIERELMREEGKEKLPGGCPLYPLSFISSQSPNMPDEVEIDPWHSQLRAH